MNLFEFSIKKEELDDCCTAYVVTVGGFWMVAVLALVALVVVF